MPGLAAGWPSLNCSAISVVCRLRPLPTCFCCMRKTRRALHNLQLWRRSNPLIGEAVERVVPLTELFAYASDDELAKRVSARLRERSAQVNGKHVCVWREGEAPVTEATPGIRSAISCVASFRPAVRSHPMPARTPMQSCQLPAATTGPACPSGPAPCAGATRNPVSVKGSRLPPDRWFTRLRSALCGYPPGALSTWIS